MKISKSSLIKISNCSNRNSKFYLRKTKKIRNIFTSLESKQIYEKYVKLDINKAIIDMLDKNEFIWWNNSLEEDKSWLKITPFGTKKIAFGGPHLYFAFIKNFDEMVFSINLEGVYYNRKLIHVYPVAENFKIFLQLILACRGSLLVDQIISLETIEDFNKEFSIFLKDEYEDIDFHKDLKYTLKKIADTLGIHSLKNPYIYVKNLQNLFDYKKLNL